MNISHVTRAIKTAFELLAANKARPMIVLSVLVGGEEL
jgi:hypothetical protein